MPFSNLLTKCDEISGTVFISIEKASAVEQETRKQSDGKLWFEQHAGRVTASKLYSVLHTDQCQPLCCLLNPFAILKLSGLFQMLTHMG